jgi:hypothetical protein
VLERSALVLVSSPSATRLVGVLLAAALVAVPAAAQDAPAPAAPAAAATAPARAKKAKPPEKSLAEQKKEDGAWMKRANWISVRAGYAKRSGGSAGDGLFGYGIGYQRNLSRRVSLNAQVQHDIVGHLGNSYEIAVPMTLELQRHFRWSESFRPYLGIGGGYHWRKYYRTGPDNGGAPVSGWHVSLGANMPIDDRHMLGIDTRVASLDGRAAVNPVFGSESSQSTAWSAKLSWSIVY